MNLRIQSLGAVFSGLMLGLACAAPAQAQLNKVDQKCRETIAKTLGKTVVSADKVSTGCHKLRNLGKVLPAVDCNDVFDAQTDSKGKFSKAQQKLEDSIFKSCTDKGASPSLVTDFVSCPEPCATSTGVPNPMVTFADVGECLACLAGDLIGRRNVVQLDDPAALSKDEGKCHAAIAKGYGKHLSTLIKERQKCQKTEDKLGNNELQPCDTSDLKLKIDGAADKAADGVADKCTGQNLTAINSCSTADVASLNACLLAEDNARGDEAFAAGYGLPATICPVRVDSTVLAGNGLDGSTARSFLEVGWRANVHNADLADRYVLSSDITCPASPPCGDCTVDGISPNGPMYATFLRCRNNLSNKCTMPFAADPACSGGECTYVLGPPLPISAANNPTCSVNTLSNDITGTVNPDGGSAELNVNLKTLVYLGIEIAQPCPVCIGDTVPQDGVRDGTCSGGDNNGGACDVDGWDSTFAPQDDNKGLSMDCRPELGKNISGSGLTIPLEFTTGHTELAFENACDSPLNSLDCACGVCTGNTAFPCRNNAECAAIAAGTCTTHGGGSAQTRRPNDCSDLTCTAVGDDKGECASGNPSDKLKFCDGQLARRANGDSFVACDVGGQSDCDNTDCDPSTPLTPDGCGNCTLEKVKPCFLDPIVDDGDPDLDNPLLVTTFCIPPTVSVAINSTGGLPGPARVAADMLTDLAY